MEKSPIIVAGSTGALGQKILKALVDKLKALQEMKEVEIVKVDYKDSTALEKACFGSYCVISALSGLREVVIDTQQALLNAAVRAGVLRFIPSDYSLDFTKTIPGENRNLDMRREFHERIAKAPIAATSIFNGAFTELLTGDAPFILFKIKRVLYWQNPDQELDFTTMDNTAAFTAAAALDSSTPRYLHIAGDRLSPKKMAEVVSSVYGTKFRLLRAGSLPMLDLIIKITRTISPAKEELYPAWQGMQYMRDMFSGLAKSDNLDNQRYADIKWKSVNAFLDNSTTFKRN
jgi:nucleoside-diphosphate-sugar epimerase